MAYINNAIRDIENQRRLGMTDVQIGTLACTVKRINFCVDKANKRTIGKNAIPEMQKENSLDEEELSRD